jgi:hypothetical protein
LVYLGEILQPCLIASILEGEIFWLSGCSNGNITSVQDFLNEVVTEASGSTCDKENARHDGDVSNGRANDFLEGAARSTYIPSKREGEITRAGSIDILPDASIRVSRTSELVIGVFRRS